MRTKRAKVVHLTSVHPTLDVRIFYKECTSLAKAGYEVTLVGPHSKDEVVDGIRIKAVPHPRGRVSRVTLTGWQVYREAVRQGADVYHFHDPELIPAGLLLRMRGKKVIYDIHEDLPDDFQEKHYLPKRLRPALAWLVGCLEKVACRRFSALTPATPTIAERLRPLNSNTVVLNNYVVLQEFARPFEITWSKRSFSLAYVGVIAPERGIRQIVQAMQLLPDGLQATLKIAGAFSPPSFKDEVANLPGWERVEALGVLDRAAIVGLLGNVRAGLVILHPEARFLWSKPIKLFEYMFAGIPVIASDFPVCREIVAASGCGLLVDPLSPKAIAEAVEHVLTHPEEAEAMGRRGRTAVERYYNWESEELKLLKLYSGLVESPCMGWRLADRWR